MESTLDALPVWEPSSVRPGDPCESSESALCVEQSQKRVSSRSDSNLRSFLAGTGRRKLDRLRGFMSGLDLLRRQGERVVRQSQWLLDLTSKFSARLASLEGRMVGNVTRQGAELAMDKKSAEKLVQRSVRQSNNLLRRHKKTASRKLRKFTADQVRDVVKTDRLVARLGNPDFVHSQTDHAVERNTKILHKIVRVDEDVLAALDSRGVQFDRTQTAIGNFLLHTVQEVNEKELAAMETRLLPQRDAALDRLIGNSVQMQQKFLKQLQSRLAQLDSRMNKAAAEHDKRLNDITESASRNLSGISRSVEALRLPDLAQSPSFRTSVVDYTPILQKIENFEKLVEAGSGRASQADFSSILRRAKREAGALVQQIDLLIEQVLRDAKAETRRMDARYQKGDLEISAAQNEATHRAASAASQTLETIEAETRNFMAEADRASKLLGNLEIEKDERIRQVTDSLRSQLAQLNDSDSRARRLEDGATRKFAAVGNLSASVGDELGSLAEEGERKLRQYAALLDSTRNATEASSLAPNLRILQAAVNTVDAFLNARKIQEFSDAQRESSDARLAGRLAHLSDSVDERLRALQRSLQTEVDDANAKLQMPVTLDDELPVIGKNFSGRMRTRADHLEALVDNLKTRTPSVFRESEISRTFREISDSWSSASARLSGDIKREIEKTALPALAAQKHFRPLGSENLDSSALVPDKRRVAAAKQQLGKAISEGERLQARLASWPIDAAVRAVEEVGNLKTQLERSVRDYNAFNSSHRLGEVEISLVRLGQLAAAVEEPSWPAMLMEIFNVSVAGEMNSRATLVADMRRTFETWKVDALNRTRNSEASDSDLLMAFGRKFHGDMEDLHAAMRVSHAQIAKTQASLSGILSQLAEISDQPQPPTPSQLVHENGTTFEQMDTLVADKLRKSEISIASQFFRAAQEEQRHMRVVAEAFDATAQAVSAGRATAASLETGQVKAQALISDQVAGLLGESSDILREREDATSRLLSDFRDRKSELNSGLRRTEGEASAIRATTNESLAAVASLVLSGTATAGALDEKYMQLRHDILKGILQGIDSSGRALETQRDDLLGEMLKTVEDIKRVPVNYLEISKSRNDQIMAALQQLADRELRNIQQKTIQSTQTLHAESRRSSANLDDSILNFMHDARGLVSRIISF